MIEQLPEAPPLRMAGQPADQRKVLPKGSDELGMTLDQLSSCRYCWGKHPGVCPEIRSIMWHPNGQVARVLLEPRPQQREAVIHPDDEAEDASMAAVLRDAMEAVIAAKTVKEARALAGRVLAALDTPTE